MSKKLMLLGLLMLAPMAAASEIFTTYDTVNDPGSDFTIEAAKITFTQLNRNVESYVLDDKGTGYFDGDFTHRFEFMITGGDNTGQATPWIVTNQIYTARWVSNAIGFMVLHDSVNFYAQLKTWESGTTDSDNSSTLSNNTLYYVEVTRDDDAGASSAGLVTAYISTGNYHGEAGASDVDTLSIDCTVQQDFRYIGLTGFSGGAALGISGYMQNLSLDAETGSQPLLPGLRAPLVGAPATPNTFRSGMSGTSTGGLDATDAEIQELARGLKYDPGLMYKFVHDHIRITPMWGQVKGPYMTWMDRSGTAFDQASLMIALLEEAADHGTEYVIEDPNFVVGEIQLSAEDAMSWLSVPNDVDVAEKVLARSGLYGTVADAGDGTIDTVNLEHVWVAVTIDGNDYEFDPSFKSHTMPTRPLELRELYQAMGYYQKSDFTTHAGDGMTETGTYVEDINTVRIAEDLKDCSADLIEYIKGNCSSADLKEVIGGASIDPVEESALPPSSLPYGEPESRDDEFSFDAIPDMYRTTLRLQHAGIDETFFSSDIYGRRLTLQYNGSNQPQLVLDGTVEATGSSTTPGQAYDLTFTVDHPYSSTSFDEATTVQVVSGGFYQVVNGWADTGTAILKKHRDLLEEYRYDGYSDTSEQVLGESYTLIGMTWLAQVSRMRSMAGEIAYSTVVNHHLVGVTGQAESGGAPYLDIPLGSMGVTADFDNLQGGKGVFLAIAGHASAYEHQVIRQFQDCNAVSTIKAFDMANDEATYGKIYKATDVTWSGTIEPALYNYSQDVIDDVNAYIDAGFTVYLPEKGDLSVDDWTGGGFQALLFDEDCMTVGYLLSGGYSGGAAADDSAVSPAEVFENCYGAESGRGGDGAYGFGNTDLSIGDGGYPFGLSFGRQYSSRRRYEDGPLGLGWTHNLDMQALTKTDSFQFLGTDSPIDAAPHIVSLYVTSGLPDPSINWLAHDVIASLCESWLMDQMTDEVVVIKQGSGTTTFVKDPNGTYNPPPGAKLKLVVQPNGNFRLKNSSGVFNDFDSEGRISQWSDAHGNEVNFTYTSGKLTQVANEIGGTVVRSITLNYTGDRITSVSDSAGRSVSYSYDGLGQMTSFTNLDANDVTYDYVSNEDGLLNEIYSPIDANNPVLTVVYDSLDRMKQQIDANDCVWDYYLATYRSEVVEPNQPDTSDPNDPDPPITRFSTIRWANPETKEVITKDQMGRETIRAYDGRFRTTSVLGATGMSAQLDYDENNNVTGVTSEAIPGSGINDITASSDYHDFEDSVTGRWFVDVNETTNVVGLVTKYEYDFDPNYPSDPNVGNVMRIIYPDVNTPNGTESRIVQFTYYSDGRIHTQTDPNGMVTHYEYYMPAQGGGLKEVVVDANGLDLTTQYTYDSVGRVVSVTDPRGNTSETEYFDSGLVRKTTAPSPFEYETVYEYYDDGKLKHVKQIVPGVGGNEVVYLQSITYNNRGQKATVRGPYPEDPNQAELQVNYTQYSYDALGRPWKVTDAEDHVTETRYYPDGKVWKVIDAKGNDAITKTYNEDGSLQKVADAKGNETHYEYNGAMKLTKTTFEDDTHEDLAYDAYRRLTGKTTRIGQTIEITYDDFGRVEAKEITDANNPVNTSNTISYAYDRLGRVVEQADDTGTITYAYDSVGRLTDVNYPGGKVVSYQYDAVGNRTRLTYPDSSYITYEYDALGRLTKVRDDANDVLAEYNFDARSRRTGLSYANGTGIDYIYDTASRLLDVNNVTDTGQLKYAYSYDDVGNRLSMSVTDSSGTKIHVYDYDNIYQVTDVDYPEDFDYLATDTTFNYDDVGNRTSVVDDDGTVNYTANALNQYTVVADANFVYDDNGNMTYDGRYEYAYDAENRLVQVTNNEADALAAACDSNLRFTTGGDAEWFAQTVEYYADYDAAQSGTIGSGEETWMETTVEGPGTVTFRYKMSSVSGDALAFYVDTTLTANYGSAGSWYQSGGWSVPAGTHTLKWSYYKYGGSTTGSCWVDAIQWTGGAPESSGGADWEQITYTYDPTGKRIAKDVDGEVTKYVYDGDQCIAEYDANDAQLRKYVYGPGIDQPICMIEVADANAAYFYHYDGLGSVVALSDAEGDTVQIYEYDVYGQVAASDPNHSNPFTFTGRRFDTETGLYYYRARYYNPTIGRFLQTDPVGYEAGMNLYRYCRNNPLNWLDPFGLAPSPPDTPKMDGYDSADDAAMAASAYIEAWQDYYPQMEADAWEWFYWIYRTSTIDPKTGYAVHKYGFTLPIPGGLGKVEEWALDLSESLVPAGGTIVGAGHSHPNSSYATGDNESFTQGDTVLIEGDAAFARWCAHIYADPNPPFPVNEFHFYLLTPSDRVTALDVRVTFDDYGAVDDSSYEADRYVGAIN